MAKRKKTAAKRSSGRTSSSSGRAKGAARRAGAARANATRRTASARGSAARGANARGAGRSDAIALLEADHREVEKLYRQYEKLVDGEASARERGAIAAQICSALKVHAQIEEELFYPPVREALEDEEDMLDEAEIEHASAKDLIAQISRLSPDDDKYDARVVVLCEYVKHHVEEEENEMFPKVRRAKELDLQALGERLAARKAELMGQQGASGSAAESRGG